MRSLIIVLAVIRHLVDEEQAQNLDPFRLHKQFLLKMLLNGCTYLLALDLIGMNLSDNFMKMQHLRARGEVDVFLACTAIDIVDDIACIDVAPARFLVDVVALAHRDRLALGNAALHLLVDLDLRRDGRFFIIHRLQAEVGVVMRILDGEAVDLDALDELFIEAVDGVELVELVLHAHGRRRIAQGAERMETSHGFQLVFRADRRLRFVDDDDGVRLAQQLDGTRPAELLVVVAIDEVHFLLKSVDDDDHDLDVRVHSEVTNLLDMVAVIDEIIVCHIVVKLTKMLLRDVERLLHALLDGVARHDDGELREAVPLVQFQQGAQIDVRLARARLHLDVEMQFLPETFRLRQAVPRLDGTHILQQIFLVKTQKIPHALLCTVEVLSCGELLFQIIGYREKRRLRRLSLKHVADGGNSFLLVGKGRIELQLHHASLLDRNKGVFIKPRTLERLLDVRLLLIGEESRIAENDLPCLGRIFLMQLEQGFRRLRGNRRCEANHQSACTDDVDGLTIHFAFLDLIGEVKSELQRDFIDDIQIRATEQEVIHALLQGCE